MKTISIKNIINNETTEEVSVDYRIEQQRALANFIQEKVTRSQGWRSGWLEQGIASFLLAQVGRIDLA